jgi:glucose/arabinose dehydrogenase
MSISAKKLVLALAGTCLIGGGTAAAAPGPPSPTAVNGHKVKLVASGLMTPTSFAFGGGHIFEGDGGNTQPGKPPVPGGVYLLKAGAGVKLAGSPDFVAGLAWHKNALYVSGGFFNATGATFKLLKWSDWNGTSFSKQTVIYTAPKKFQGFNGIAFGPDGRLYVGADLGLLSGNDHGAHPSPYVYDILSIKPNGKGLKVYATGIRQPWQMVFPKGSAAPLVSDLGQDKGAKNPPDFLLKVKKGDNYGFPQCNHTKGSKCKGFAKPWKSFSPHTDIMGLAIVGKTLYMTSFLGTTGSAGEVLSMPLKGGKVKPVVKGHVAPIVGLGQNRGTLYIGELTGRVFSFKP